MNPIISASILSADWGKLKEEIHLLETAKVDWIHVDVMDGRFVSNITFGVKFVETLRHLTNLPLDVHLMIEEPEKHIDTFIKAGSDLITVHTESTRHLQRLIVNIKEQGPKVGVALNPATSLDSLKWVLNDIDLVLIMSVNPGLGGQKFIPVTLDKVKYFKKNFDFSGYISVDGGINEITSESILHCGVDVLVVGSYLFEGGGSYSEKVTLLKDRSN